VHHEAVFTGMLLLCGISPSVYIFITRTITRTVTGIYRPTKEKDGTCQIKSHEELNRLTGNKNIINYINAQRLAWFGHEHRMPDNSMVKKSM